MKDLQTPVWEDELKEECGVVGIYRTSHWDNAVLMYSMLHALQHRGQDGAGIAAARGEEAVLHKNVGLLKDVFDVDAMQKLEGYGMMIGHVRYATSAAAHDVLNTQPLLMHAREGFFALCHNGNIINSAELCKDLQQRGHLMQTGVDTELLMHIISEERLGTTLEQGILKMMKKVRGSYSIVLMAPGVLIGVRDPWGVRPLCLGKFEDGWAFASESSALNAAEATLVRELEPGEIVIVDGCGIRSVKYEHATKGNMCAFEYVYFARGDSTIDGVSVYGARFHCGQKLALTQPVDADIVAGVPDSAVPAALGYSAQSGIPFAQVLLKNPYSGRTFIQATQEQRRRSVRMKLSPLEQQLRGKRVVLVDDSIVRGTNSLQLVDMIKQAGAKEVHMRIASPPVRYCCNLGINTPVMQELINAFLSVDEVCSQIHADSLRYLAIEDLTQAVREAGRQGSDRMCMACFNNESPVVDLE